MRRSAALPVVVVLGLVPVVVVAALTATLVWASDRGLDLTDESYYLLWAERPADVWATPTQFGHYTSLLYRAVGRDLAAFRIGGVVLLFAGAAVFGLLLDRLADRLLGRDSSRLERASRVSTIVVGAAFYYSHWWLLTPSYNWLSLVGVLLCFSGLMYSALVARPPAGHETPVRRLYAGAAVVGVSGVLTFFAKPPTAAVLAVLAVVWMVANLPRKSWPAFLAIGGLTMIVALELHVLLFEHGHAAFLEEIRQARRLAVARSDSRSILSILARTVQEVAALPAIVAGASGSAWLGLLIPLPFLVSQKMRERWLRLTDLGAAVAVAAAFWWLHRGGVFSSQRLEGIAMLAIVAIAGGAFVIAAALGRLVEGVEGGEPGNRVRLVVLGGTLIAGPFAVALGSSNGMRHQLSVGAVFFVAAALLLARMATSGLDNAATPPLLAALIAVAAISAFSNALDVPYLLARPIAGQSETVRVRDYEIRVDPETKTYFERLTHLAGEAGWVPGTPLIDMTGDTPAAAYVLGATAPVKPWLVGGYEGSASSVQETLRLYPANDLRRAWVLTAPEGRADGRPSIPTEVLTGLGIDFPDGYELLGELVRPWGGRKQYLWRPITDHPGGQTAAFDVGPCCGRGSSDGLSGRGW